MQSPVLAEDISIQVAPSVLNLDSNGTWVTVHADIPYSLVDATTVALNGIEVQVTKADDCGDLVAKFPLDAVKSIIGEDCTSVTLTLTGTTDDGDVFSGSDVVGVTKSKKK